MRRLSNRPKRLFPRARFLVAVLPLWVLAGTAGSCIPNTWYSNEEITTVSVADHVGGVTYIQTLSIPDALNEIRQGQTKGGGQRFGDVGTVVEWNVDFAYLFYPDPNNDFSPQYSWEERTEYLKDRLGLDECDNGLYAWYLVELWGGDGGDVDTLNNPPIWTAEEVAEHWEEDHFTATDELSVDYAYGGKGGYMKAYMKLYAGVVLYFFLGGKGMDGTSISSSGVGEEMIYGFNGGGKGSGGHTQSFTNGGGGGGATSLAFNMPLFTQSGDDWMFDFTEGYATLTPGGIPQTPELLLDAHYESRLLVAGGGGGGAQSYGDWVSLHGGDGNGGMGEARIGGANPSGWQGAGTSSYKSDVVTMSASGGLEETSYEVVDGGPWFFRRTIKDPLNTYALTLPPASFGRGVDGGDSVMGGSYFEGRGGGGGGWTGGGAIFDPANAAGGLPSSAYATAGGNGGTNGVYGMAGERPATTPNTITCTVPYYDDVNNLIRDGLTNRILSEPSGTRQIIIIPIKDAETGPAGLGGVKTRSHLESFSKEDLKGNGFINVTLMQKTDVPGANTVSCHPCVP